MFNAAAISSGDNRLPQLPVQKRRRWTSCLCFGFQRRRKRMGHGVIVPESSASTQPPMPIPLPFIAPPSSPASFLQSEPPSAPQSPASGISLASKPAFMHSPSGPYSMFAIGPYAYETQLVSPPPPFSTLTTAPSTAPFTPESVHFTTHSSPEGPFSLSNSATGLQFEFHSYKVYPGSPEMSPSSWVSGSGTSSPFPDGDFAAAAGPRFLEFHIPDSPKSLNLGNVGQGSGTLTQDASNFGMDSEFSDAASPSSNRVSFDSWRGAFTCAEPKQAIASSPVIVIPANAGTSGNV